MSHQLIYRSDFHPAIPDVPVHEVHNWQSLGPGWALVTQGSPGYERDCHVDVRQLLITKETP